MKVDLIGKRIGKLTVLEKTENKKNGSYIGMMDKKDIIKANSPHMLYFTACVVVSLYPFFIVYNSINHYIFLVSSINFFIKSSIVEDNDTPLFSHASANSSTTSL